MVIAPSLLAANFARLENEVRRVNRSGASWLHLDIMDGHFVPNISFGPAVVGALRPLSRLFFDVHLMCSKPDVLLEPFAKAGADQLNIHVELGPAEVTRLLWRIKALGKKAGLVVNPPTPIHLVQRHLGQIDNLLVMTVNPGFGGQSFIYETLPKIESVRQWRAQKRLGFRISVDGGVDQSTCGDCAQAGADTFISGTALFKQANLKAAVSRMLREVSANAVAGELNGR